MAGEPSSTGTDTPAKKPYHAPRLDELGDVREVTRSVDSSGSPDGGHGSMTRTG